MSYIVRNSLFTKGVSLMLILTFVMAFVMIDFTPAHAGFIGSVFHAVKKAVGGIGKAVKGVFHGVSKVVSGVTKKFGGFLGKVGSFLKKKVMPFVAKVAPIVGAVASIVAPYLAPAFAGIVSAIGTGAKIASSVCTLIKSKGKNLLGAVVGMAGSLGGSFGGIMGKVGAIAGKVSKGIGMIKSGNIGGFLSAVGGIKGMPFASTLSSLGASTTAAGNGFKGLLSAVGGKILKSPLAQKLMGTATNFLGAAKGKIPGIAGNLKGLVGKVTGVFTSAASKNPTSILGKIGGFINKSGFTGKANGFIDALATKASGKIDGILSKLTSFKVETVVNKFAVKYGAKLEQKVVGKKINAKIGRFQGLLGSVQSFAKEAQSKDYNLVAMLKNAETAMKRNGSDKEKVLSDVLGLVNTTKYRIKLTTKIATIKNKKVREYAKKALRKLPSDMKLKQSLRSELVKLLK